MGKKINVFRENDLEHLKTYLAEAVREVIYSEAKPEEEEEQPQEAPPGGGEAPPEKVPQAKDADPEPEGEEAPEGEPEEQSKFQGLAEALKTIFKNIMESEALAPHVPEGYSAENSIEEKESKENFLWLKMAVPHSIVKIANPKKPDENIFEGQFRGFVWAQLKKQIIETFRPQPGTIIKSSFGEKGQQFTFGEIGVIKVEIAKGKGGKGIPNKFATKSEITEKLFLVGDNGKPTEGTRGGKTYRQWSDGKGGVIELCSCAAPLEEGGCGEFLKFEATENPETGEHSEGYISVAPNTPEYQICSDAQKTVLSTIDSTLAEWQDKAAEAAAIMNDPNPKSAADGQGTSTGAINKWMGEMGEVVGVRQLIAAGADAALYTDSEVKNDAVIFSAGKARELKVDSVSIKSSYGEHVNALGSSALPDLDHIFEGKTSATIMGKEVNPDHFIASIFQIRNAFLKILGGKEGAGATAPVDKGKWQITPEAIKEGYYLPAAKAAIGKEINATQFKEYRIITEAEFSAIWSSPEFTSNASKRAPVFRDLKAKKVKFDQSLYDACKAAMEPLTGNSLKVLDGWIARQAADVIDSTKVEWTAATDLMMVRADATNKGAMDVKYLTMEAQKDLLKNKATSGEKIIKEIIGLAPKTNISGDWSIRGLQHGVPPKETREVKSAKAVDTAEYLRQIGAEPEAEPAPEEPMVEKVLAILKQGLNIS